MTIDDAEHISPKQRQKIIDSYPPHEREARVKGLPALGSGRVFPTTEESISVDAFRIPAHWAKISGIDFGWDHPTAAVQIAHDRDADTIYVTHAYRRKEAVPVQHWAALSAWPKTYWSWPPDAVAREKTGGKNLKNEYLRCGMQMLAVHAQFEEGGNSVEAGVQAMFARMQDGRLKVFSHLRDWFEEFRMYHRKDGLIVKERDDLMDATRYAWMMLRFAEPDFDRMESEDAQHGWGHADGRSAAGY